MAEEYGPYDIDDLSYADMASEWGTRRGHCQICRWDWAIEKYGDQS